MELRRSYGWRYETAKGYSLDGPVYRIVRWKIAVDRLDRAIDEIEAIASRSDLLRKRAAVQLWWEFKWIDPRTGIILPDQDYWSEIDIRRPRYSVIHLHMGATTTVDFGLLFPFTSIDSHCREYIRNLQAHLPVKLSEKHWRLFDQDKSGEWKPHKGNPFSKAPE